ncbi:MAG: hypothetical protein SFT92_07715 [Rickettsiales bacterium]|nr:hypothetical protein [Rickettsiales bacterium]
MTYHAFQDKSKDYDFERYLKTGLLLGQNDKQRFELWFANLFGLLDIVAVATGLACVYPDV